ncbi:BCCT family transporter [Porticoccaceae bacterium]|nr:BCCT family transporter [Porticoccaceae bacterium]MDB2620989.1 BCCT family transporter [Porticoccaceae bacterium]MDB2669841.1 BCCT family transporter [Porticoccaceae bacterium]
MSNSEPEVDWAVFIPAVIIVLVCTIPLMIFPESASQILADGRKIIMTNFLWLYLIVGISAFLFCLWLVLGRYAHVKLGAPDESPEYSDMHWVAMMFTTAIGASVIAWGFAEPIFYLQTPPLGIEVGSTKSFEWAHMYPLLHWGIVPWSMYALPAVPIAYMLYVKRYPVLRISSACDGALPKRGRDQIKTIIDILIVLGIVGGVATSLGLGVPLLSAMLSTLFEVPDSMMIKMSVLSLWTLLFGASVYRGLKSGIKVLADINIVLAIFAIFFVLIAGPGVFIMDLTVNSIGLMFNNFISTATWTDPIENGSFPEDWTGFYWGWWLAYTGMVGLFFGRISRGRTIRQLVLGVICWGCLGTWLFLAVMGGYSLYLETTGTLAVKEILSTQGMSFVNALVIQSLPFGKFTLFIFTLLSIIFYATTIDSSAYVLSSISAKNLRSDAEPKRWNRLAWAVLLALITAGILQSGALDTVLSITVLSSVPLIPILLILSISLVRWLNQDFGEMVSPKEISLAVENVKSNS